MPTTASYVQTLCKPLPRSSSERHVWNVGLSTVWVPFFTATNATGDTQIPAAALGAPLRLARDKSGAPRLSSTGRPVIRVATELNEAIRNVRANFIAALMNHVEDVAATHPGEFRHGVEAARIAAEPIQQRDGRDIAHLQAAADQAAADQAAADQAAADQAAADQAAADQAAAAREMVPA